MTQHEMIIDYVKEFGSITPMDAFMDLGHYQIINPNRRTREVRSGLF